MIFSIFQVSGDSERWFNSVRHVIPRCRSTQIFGVAKNFCPNFRKLARKNFERKWPPTKTSSLSFCVPFLQNKQTYSNFADVCTYFSQISSHFARIFVDFARIFTNSKLLGVRLHLLHPRFLHQYFTLCSMLLERLFSWNSDNFTTLVVMNSETDSVKFNDASVYRHTIFLWLKTGTLQSNDP